MRETNLPAQFLIGCQEDGSSRGIVRARLDERTGELGVIGLAAEVSRPTWLLRDPERPFLFAVSEVGNKGERNGEVLSFRIGVDGALQLLDRTSSLGGGATHLDLSADGAALFVANFGGCQAACAAIAPDGKFSAAHSTDRYEGSGPHRRQQGSHPHGVTLDPGQRFLLVPDMGADRVFIHRYDPVTATLDATIHAQCELSAGSGPRLLLFGCDGRHAYLLTELSAQLVVFDWDAVKGELNQIAMISLDPLGAEGEPSAAVLMISSDGRHLYVSNRRTNAIHLFAIDPATGLLESRQTVDCGGSRPWGATISPNGRWLLIANQGSNNVVSLRRDPESGTLGEKIFGTLTTATPTCISFL